MKFADLHVHTFFSDGTSSVPDLLNASKRAGLSCIAITDHDTIAAVPLAEKASAEFDLEIIPGIELSTEYNGLEVHILGYFIDYKNNYLIKRLNSLRDARIERIYKITAKLNELGVKLNPETVFGIAKNGTVGRLHIARAMVKEGIVGSTGEAFAKYIGDNCPAYVCGFRFTPQEAINLIADSHGLSVLAHPYLLKNDDLIAEFAKYGIKGLEVYYPEHTQSMNNFYLEKAKKFNLLVTGGSDFHGSAKPDVKMGMVKLPYKFVELLKEKIK